MSTLLAGTPQTFINLWRTTMGIEASAHPSMEDALDDIAEPAGKSVYIATLTQMGSGWVECCLADEARQYADEVTRQWRLEQRHEAGLRSLSNKF